MLKSEQSPVPMLHTFDMPGDENENVILLTKEFSSILVTNETRAEAPRGPGNDVTDACRASKSHVRYRSLEYPNEYNKSLTNK